VWQHLQGHVLEGTGGAVPQLQTVGVFVHRPNGCHLLHIELLSAVGLVRIGRQLRGREIVQIGVHHIDGPLLVGHVPHGVQGVVGQLWKYLGGHQAAVRSQSLGDCLRRRAPVFLVPRAYIVHTSLTTLIRFSKNRARTSASL